MKYNDLPEVAEELLRRTTDHIRHDDWYCECGVKDCPDLERIEDKTDLLKTLEYVHGWLVAWDIYYIPGASDVLQRVEQALVAAHRRRGL